MLWSPIKFLERIHWASVWFDFPLIHIHTLSLTPQPPASWELVNSSPTSFKKGLKLPNLTFIVNHPLLVVASSGQRVVWCKHPKPPSPNQYVLSFMLMGMQPPSQEFGSTDQTAQGWIWEFSSSKPVNFGILYVSTLFRGLLEVSTFSGVVLHLHCSGNEAFKEGSWKQAAVYYMEGLSLPTTPIHHILHSNCAACFLKLGRPDKVIQVCVTQMKQWKIEKTDNRAHECAENSASNPLPWFFCSAQALEHSDKGLELNPEFSKSHFRRGLSLQVWCRSTVTSCMNTFIPHV